ncbi:ImmA/IrrE family metallo-endopeptidase [Arcanobacterium haemolyticum]|nr:ImmA/IrrE family metallo-endopeptidase [Arcanobacterium haemolyticum]
MTENQLIADLERQGVHVVYLPFPTAGVYYHAQRLIIIDTRQPPSCQLAALAHEYVHAKHEHDGCQREEVELHVDEEAARLIISPAEYALAEQLYEPHPATIADELGVSTSLVEAYQRTLAKA